MLSTELKKKYETLNNEQRLHALHTLLPFVSEHKNQLFQKYIQYRTRHITVILEDLFQPHNASAVLRTCDCFGVQDIHIIENNNEYNVNPDVTLGSDQWINIYRYNTYQNNTVQCLRELKKKGYRIVATSPHKNEYTINTLPIDSKFALVFGAELPGLSQYVFDMADEYVKIPMYGFTESFNISVSAGIMLHHLTEKLKASNVLWQLTEEEQNCILFEWACTVIKKPEIHLKQMFG